MKHTFSAKNITIVAMFTAITAVLAQISIPLPFTTVPITMQVFAIYLSEIILGRKLGFISQIVYLLLGSIGAPVFAHFSGGMQCVLGPTGGFLIGFPIVTYIIGMIPDKKLSVIKSISLLIISIILLYAMGVIQLSIVTKISLSKAIIIGALPFIPLDIVKIIVAYVVGIKIRERLEKGNLIKTC
ncbi:BioY family protein [Clostridium botulinum C/D str. BKT12695]|nr:BioY family protein [Clostridium botulinum C/D str. BKT12695]